MERRGEGPPGYITWAFDKDVDRALSLSHEALDIARRIGEIHTEMLATGGLGLILVRSGRVPDGMRLLDLATAAAVWLPADDSAVSEPGGNGGSLNQ